MPSRTTTPNKKKTVSFAMLQLATSLVDYQTPLGLPFQQSHPSHLIVTDTSTMGWCAHCYRREVQAIWSAHKRTHHINFLKLLAVLKALKAFRAILYGHTIQITTDNTLVMYHLNKRGRTYLEATLHRDITFLPKVAFHFHMSQTLLLPNFYPSPQKNLGPFTPWTSDSPWP